MKRTGLEPAPEIKRVQPRGKKVKKGKKELALRAAREEGLNENLLQAVAGLVGNVNAGEAVGQPAAAQIETEEKTVKTRKKATSTKQNARTPVRNGRTNGHGHKTKRAQIVDLARQKHGCTNADVFALTGWPSVSMPQVVESQGIPLSKLHTVKEGKHLRYFIRAA